MVHGKSARLLFIELSGPTPHILLIANVDILYLRVPGSIEPRRQLVHALETQLQIQRKKYALTPFDLRQIAPWRLGDDPQMNPLRVELAPAVDPAMGFVYPDPRAGELIQPRLAAPEWQLAQGWNLNWHSWQGVERAIAEFGGSFLARGLRPCGVEANSIGTVLLLSAATRCSPRRLAHLERVILVVRAETTLPVRFLPILPELNEPGDEP
jgi:hypothetical protein